MKRFSIVKKTVQEVPARKTRLDPEGELHIIIIGSVQCAFPGCGKHVWICTQHAADVQIVSVLGTSSTCSFTAFQMEED